MLHFHWPTTECLFVDVKALWLFLFIRESRLFTLALGFAHKRSGIQVKVAFSCERYENKVNLNQFPNSECGMDTYT